MLSTGIAASEHILGNNIVWRVSEIVKEDIYIAHRHVVYVHCGCGSSHGFIWTPEIINYLAGNFKSFWCLTSQNCRLLMSWRQGR